MSLKDLQIGDDVVVTSINLGTKKEKVVKVGHKYLGIGRDEFCKTSGLMKTTSGLDSRKRAFSLSDWARAQNVQAAQKLVAELHELRKGFEHLSSAEMQELMFMLETVATKLSAVLPRNKETVG